MKKIYSLIIVLLCMNLFTNIYMTPKALESDINMISVDIKGAVINPGLYEIPVNTTVWDLIAIAGGLREDADTSLINLSKRLGDEDVVIVYTIDEIEDMRTSDTKVLLVEKECMCPKVENVACTSKKNNLIGIININQASLDELQKLSGIGKSKAEAIIAYRNSQRFEKPEDITKVKGIGKAIYEKNKDNIGV